MAPVATTTTTTTDTAPVSLKPRPQGQAEAADPGKSRLDVPMAYTGALDSYKVSS